MPKQIQVSTEIYTRLKTEAQGNYRTIGGQIEFLLDNQAFHPVPAKDLLKSHAAPMGRVINGFGVGSHEPTVVPIED